ncbi:MAG: hypothetical protein OEZ39_06015 [Gammaproteobacteria bacterium]|nr:hypothetical protein [Gammaproteobacteria bacterium]MDH5651410.1 hypothetical protein [Gammaproteobacteria bacterium]
MKEPAEAQHIYTWLDRMAATVTNKQLPEHMELVSNKVEVYGNPSKEVINYMGWYKRRKNEFEKNSVICLTFSGVKIKTIAQRRIIFNVNETIAGTDGRILLMNKDVTLEREDDDQWRVVEENIRSWKQQKMNEAMASNG